MSSKSNPPLFGQFSIEELKKLVQLKAPASVHATYTALIAHDFKKTCAVFPSVRRLSELTTLPERTTFWALKWLRENHIIAQAKNPRSKKRFILKIRSGVEWVRKAVKGGSTATGCRLQKTRSSESKRTRYRHYATRCSVREKLRRDNFIVNKEAESFIPKSMKQSHWIWMEHIRHAEDINSKIMRDHPGYSQKPNDISDDIIKAHLPPGGALDVALKMKPIMVNT